MSLLWTANLEAGDWSEFDTAPGAGMTVTGGAALRGSYGIHTDVTAGGTSAIKSVGAVTELWLRFYANLTSMGGNVGDVNCLVQVKNIANSKFAARLFYKKTATGRGMYVEVYDGAGASTNLPATPFEINLNQWYRIEVHTLIHATAGGAEFYLDGTQIGGRFDLNTSAIADCGRIVVVGYYLAGQVVYERDAFRAATTRLEANDGQPLANVLHNHLLAGAVA